MDETAVLAEAQQRLPHSPSLDAPAPSRSRNRVQDSVTAMAVTSVIVQKAGESRLTCGSIAVCGDKRQHPHAATQAARLPGVRTVVKQNKPR